MTSHLPDLMGFLAAGLTLTAFTLRTLIPMRIAAIGANIAFILYGALGGLLPPLILHSLLLPVNAYRLHQMLGLVRAVRAAAAGDLDLDWLRPFMHARATQAGERVFETGQRAEAIYFVVSGSFRLPEIDKTVGAGELIGEIGFVAEDQTRTLSLASLSSGQLLTISFEDVRKLYFQNPKFGFYLLKLVTRRLLSDIQRLEADGRNRPALAGNESGAVPIRGRSPLRT